MSTIPTLMDNDGNLWLVDYSPASKGLFVSGPNNSAIDKFTIDIKSNGVLFGSLSLPRHLGAGASNSTKGFLCGGYTTNTTHETSQIDTFDLTASSYTGSIWGNLITARFYCGGFSNDTRGLICSGSTTGYNGNVTSIEKITLSTQNSASSYGSMTGGVFDSPASNSTIGFLMGGLNASCIEISTIFKFIFMTDGNCSSFGTLITSRGYADACSNSIRAIVAGGYKYQSPTGNLITMETLIFTQQTSSLYFGDLSVSSYAGGAMASNVTGIIALSYSTASLNTVEYVRFSTLCSTSDFGDLTTARTAPEGLSNTHGGLYVTNNGTGINVLCGGQNATSSLNVMDYFYSRNISSLSTFGSLAIAASQKTQFTSQTKGFLYGDGYTQRFDYASKGNSETFGMVDSGGSYTAMAGASNCIRGVVCGGYRNSNFISNIFYSDLPMSMTAQSFGNMSVILGYNTCIANSIKAVSCGGYNNESSNLSNKEYVNFTMKSNSSSNGALANQRKYLSSYGSPTKAICVGGHADGYLTLVDYFILSTTNTSQSFGSLSVGWGEMSCSSDSVSGYANTGHWDTLTYSNQITQSTIATFSSFAIIASLSVQRTFSMACGDAQGSLQI